jgi:hypothetical protein
MEPLETRACTHKSRSLSNGWSMSALLPIADIERRHWNVRFGPQADISARPADGLAFEFELFDLPYSALDPRLGHPRLDGV